MDTRAPHDIVPEAVLRQLPPEVRRRFVPLPENDAERVRSMSPDERARYLAEHPADELRLRRAQEKRQRKAEGKLRDELSGTTPTLEGLDLGRELHSREH